MSSRLAEECLISDGAQAREQHDLIRRAKQGDQQAFSALYLRHKRQIYSLCLRMLHNEHDAEDLMQEAFLQGFCKLHTFRGDSAFSTWLHRVTVNVVLMRLRKKRWREMSIEDTLTLNEDEAAPVLLRKDDQRLVHTTDRVTLERAVAQLAPGYRLVLLMHDVLGFEHQEAARVLGCSTGNCKSQLHKARLKLRGLLSNRVGSR